MMCPPNKKRLAFLLMESALEYKESLEFKLTGGGGGSYNPELENKEYDELFQPGL